MVRPPMKRLVVPLIVLCIGAGLLVVACWRNYFLRRDSTPPSDSEIGQLLAQLSALREREEQIDKTVWAKERLAERYGALFESLWDSLNVATNKIDRLASFPIGQMAIGIFETPQKLSHGIELRESTGSGAVWSQAQWKAFLAESARAGWQLTQAEFRHHAFETNAHGEAKQSRFYFRADVANTNANERATLEGDIVVEWLPDPPAVKQIDASHLRIKSRRGAPPFQQILLENFQPPERGRFIDPLILYDLDGDGLSEIILAAKNLVYRRRGGGHYEAEQLCQHPVNGIHTAVIADFDGDGLADFLCATADGLFLFKGSPKGTFEEPGRLVWKANPPLKYGQVLTCGDIDHDGDLDVFLGQYKIPYPEGQLPTPYYDANDGDPAYLLLNDGQGNFTDATDSSGLQAKRWRRSDSGSFVKLAGDEHLGLVVVSDFAGLDVYRNDGHGHFTDVTRQSVADPLAFGMAHALADFNADGRRDLLMIGMESPTVNRLEHLGLWRSEAAQERPMRARMVYGNRLFLAGAQGGLEQTAFNDSIAHSGWSWGCSAFDFDNDGFPDVYIANGHESKKSTRDYEGEYWLHDRFLANSQNNELVRAYLQSKVQFTHGREQSFGGYEINRLYLNRGGASFLEAGYLLGVGLQQDCRDVVADDLDGDGRMDLLVTTSELWPEAKQTLRVYRNTLEDAGDWIGFRFREAGGGRSPVGVTVSLAFAGHSLIRQLVTGDSYRSQSATTLHFGLGSASQVERAEIVWPNGDQLLLKQPKVNQYHLISPPGK